MPIFKIPYFRSVTVPIVGQSPIVLSAMTITMTLAVALLGGCALAPGLRVGQGTPEFEITTSRSATGATSSPAVIPITPELNRAQNSARATSVDPDLKRLFGVARPYVIGAGDVLNVAVWGHPEMTTPPSGLTTNAIDASGVLAVANGYNVSPEGLIQYPYLGSIKLAGLTEIQARDALTLALSKYLKDPQLTLRIQAFRSGRVYVDGEVRSPGLQAINDVPLTLPEALARAGGLLATANRASVFITRDGSTIQVDLAELASHGVNPSSILLGNGDQVRVANREDAKVFVLGEVLRPSALPMRSGRMTLNEALGESGGISQASGDARQVYVLRNGGMGNPEIYHLDAKSAADYALADGFELKARDVVYVDPSALVRFNRVISLLIPTGQFVNSSIDTTKK